MLASDVTRWITVVLVFVGALAISYLLFTGQATCGDGPPGTELCLLFTLFKDFQTFVAALIALGAAFVAVRPVYRQLLAMHVQNELTSRRIVADRLSRIEARTTADYQSVEKIHTDMQYHMDHDRTRFYSPFNEPYAFEKSGDLSSVVRKLEASQEEQLGTKQIEDARSILIERTKNLERCLHLIGLPGWISVDEDTTEQDVLDAVPRAKMAESELYDRWLEVNGALQDFQAISKEEQDRLRRRIRRIDDMIIDQ